MRSYSKLGNNPWIPAPGNYMIRAVVNGSGGPLLLDKPVRAMTYYCICSTRNDLRVYSFHSNRSMKAARKYIPKWDTIRITLLVTRYGVCSRARKPHRHCGPLLALPTSTQYGRTTHGQAYPAIHTAGQQKHNIPSTAGQLQLLKCSGQMLDMHRNGQC